MSYKQIKIVAIVFAVFLSLDSFKLLNAQGNEAASAVVKKIEFKGNDRVSSSTIKAAIKTNQGDIYDPKAISQDVDAIWLLGFFDNIEVEVEPYEDGVKVIFLVLERPVIKSIVFVGNDEVKTKKLSDAIQIREGDYLKRYLLKLDEDKIQNSPALFTNSISFPFRQIAQKTPSCNNPRSSRCSKLRKNLHSEERFPLRWCEHRKHCTPRKFHGTCKGNIGGAGLGLPIELKLLQGIGRGLKPE